MDPNPPDLAELELDWHPKTELDGILVDDDEAKPTGEWNHGADLLRHVENGNAHIDAVQILPLD